MKILIEYYLPNQSHLFSEPQRIIANNGKEYNALVKKIKKLGYEIAGVSRVR